MVTATALALLIGIMIGVVGLGGFLLVPVLMLAADVSVRDAVVIASVAFLASGIVSLLLWRRRVPAGTFPVRAYLLAAGPGAMAGAVAVDAIAGSSLTLVIAIAFFVAGVAEWLGTPREREQRSLGTPAAVASGFATGMGSALTGTSGPMVAMPLLAWIGMTLRGRIALGQVTQIPIALGATLVFVGAGDVRWSVAGWICAALCGGLVIGGAMARRVEVQWLRRASAVLMIGASLAMVSRI